MENDRYKDKTYIGTGGMARVYKAYDQVLARDVAVKELAEQHRGDDHLRKMFLEEARKMAQLDHHNVVRVYDVLDGEVPTILMEYMGGGSLASRMGAQGLPSSIVVPLLEQVIHGLKEVHDAGMIHRDLKPENILEHEGNYKITDFGVAISGEEDTLPFVTNKYAAPEVLSDPGNIKASSDIYSLGIMGIELLLGSKRFEDSVREALLLNSENLAVPAMNDSTEVLWQQWIGGRASLPSLLTLDESISPELSEFLARLTDRDQAARPQDCDALLLELEQIKHAEGERVDAPTEHDPKMKRQMEKAKAKQTEGPKEKKKRPLWFTAIVAIGVALLLAIGLLLMLPSQFNLDIATKPPGAKIAVNGQPLEDSPTPTALNADWGDEIVLQFPGAQPIALILEENMEGLSTTDAGWQLEVELPMPVSILNSAEAANYLSQHLPTQNPLTLSLDNIEPVENGYIVEVNTPLNYQVSAPQSGYLVALHLGSDNVLTLIYPNPRGTSPQINKDEGASVGKEIDLMTTEPLGKEWMVFLVVDEAPDLPAVRGAQTAGEWALRFPFGGQDSPGRDMVLWLEELAAKDNTSAAIKQVEVVYRVSES